MSKSKVKEKESKQAEIDVSKFLIAKELSERVLKALKDLENSINI